MGRARVLEEIRVMRFEELLDRHERGHLTQAEAAEMLGVSERTFRRWQGRWRTEGADGLRDRRIGKPSPRRAAAEEIAAMLGLYREHYEGFTVKHFHELAERRHGYKLGYTVTRLALQGAGLVRPAPRRGAPDGGRAGRWRACCCTRTARGICGCRGSDGRSTSSRRSTMPRARSSRPSWSRRKAR